MKTTSSTKSIHGIDIHGISTSGKINWNLSTAELSTLALARKEGVVTKSQALSCRTGSHTGRSTKDKFIVQDNTTKNLVDWGNVNQPISSEHFAALRKDQLDYLKDKELFVRDAFGGKDPQYRIPVRVINESAWANLFCKHLLVRPTENELANHLPQFTIIHTPGFKATPEKHGTRSETFIITNFSEGLILIGGTEYAGEMKKSIFGILNFLYPLQGIMPMHCSANVSTDMKNSALFFGLSGTGKTTLSADPHRLLIGDDEHGWTDEGIFNFEGGCYAKCIDLSQEKEPQIWDAIRDGAILENVVVDKDGIANYADVSLTENTRAAYPIEHIEAAVESGCAGHPQNIIFLTCDAFGVMPPVSKLTAEQAMYHFLNGYTAKVAGTEQGMGNTPQATFSSCFGAPFLPLPPTTYAELLGKKMRKHNAHCWLVNTGWIGGAYGTGNRIKLSYTRQIINEILAGNLENTTFVTDSAFGLMIPTAVNEVPSEILNPRTAWSDAAAYDKQAAVLVDLFTNNFKKFENSFNALIGAGETKVAANGH